MRHADGGSRRDDSVISDILRCVQCKTIIDLYLIALSPDRHTATSLSLLSARQTVVVDVVVAVACVIISAHACATYFVGTTLHTQTLATAGARRLICACLSVTLLLLLLRILHDVSLAGVWLAFRPHIFKCVYKLCSNKKKTFAIYTKCAAITIHHIALRTIISHTHRHNEHIT